MQVAGKVTLDADVRAAVDNLVLKTYSEFELNIVKRPRAEAAYIARIWRCVLTACVLVDSSTSSLRLQELTSYFQVSLTDLLRLAPSVLRAAQPVMCGSGCEQESWEEAFKALGLKELQTAFVYSRLLLTKAKELYASKVSGLPASGQSSNSAAAPPFDFFWLLFITARAMLLPDAGDLRSSLSLLVASLEFLLRHLPPQSKRVPAAGSSSLSRSTRSAASAGAASCDRQAGHAARSPSAGHTSSAGGGGDAGGRQLGAEQLTAPPDTTGNTSGACSTAHVLGTEEPQGALGSPGTAFPPGGWVAPPGAAGQRGQGGMQAQVERAAVSLEELLLSLLGPAGLRAGRAEHAQHAARQGSPPPAPHLQFEALIDPGTGTACPAAVAALSAAYQRRLAEGGGVLDERDAAALEEPALLAPPEHAQQVQHAEQGRHQQGTGGEAGGAASVSLATLRLGSPRSLLPTPAPPQGRPHPPSGSAPPLVNIPPPVKASGKEAGTTQPHPSLAPTFQPTAASRKLPAAPGTSRPQPLEGPSGVEGGGGAWGGGVGGWKLWGVAVEPGRGSPALDPSSRMEVDGEGRDTPPPGRAGDPAGNFPDSSYRTPSPPPRVVHLHPSRSPFPPSAQLVSNGGLGSGADPPSPAAPAFQAISWLQSLAPASEDEALAALMPTLAGCGLDEAQQTALAQQAQRMSLAAFPDNHFTAPADVAPGSMQLEGTYLQERRREALCLYCQSLGVLLRGELERAATAAAASSPAATGGSSRSRGTGAGAVPRGPPPLRPLLLSCTFNSAMMACAGECVVACHQLVSLPFPAIPQALALQPFDFQKVMDRFVRQHPAMPRGVKRHLLGIQERILESLAWQPGSSLYTALVAACGPRASSAAGTGAASASQGTPASTPPVPSFHAHCSISARDSSPGSSPSTAAAGGVAAATVACPSRPLALEESPAKRSRVGRLAAGGATAAAPAPGPTPASPPAAHGGPAQQAQQGTVGVVVEGESNQAAEWERLPLSIGRDPLPGVDLVAHALLCEFLKSMLRLAAVRLSGLVERMALEGGGAQTLLQQSYTLVSQLLYSHTWLQYGRHLDQLLLCAVYGTSRACQVAGVSFRGQLAAYRQLAHCRQDTYKSVRLQGTATGDVIAFYNQVFLPAARPVMLQVAGGDLPEVPLPSNLTQLRSPARRLAANPLFPPSIPLSSALASRSPLPPAMAMASPSLSSLFPPLLSPSVQKLPPQMPDQNRQLPPSWLHLVEGFGAASLAGPTRTPSTAGPAGGADAAGQ